MPRGGKREGAGRPPNLSYLDKFRIGGFCESLQREFWKSYGEEILKQKTPKVRKEWEKVQAIPVPERKKWLESFAFEDHKENVSFALREDQGINADDGREPDRVLRTEVPKPYKLRGKILNEAVNEFGLKVDKIDKCWKFYRQEMKKLRSEKA